MDNHLFPYKWKVADTIFTKDKGKVFSCFSGGGGSTYGYKLAGFDVIGCCEMDKLMFDTYCANHHPRLKFNRQVQGLWKSAFVTEELKNLDILDGSPPCSSFSLAGNREENWGEKKVFREGQKAQVLDTLFFDFIELAKQWQPKVVVAGNVQGILMGKARQYVKRIYEDFDKAGYVVQHFELDAQNMGVPQRRERVFFIALRKDLCSQFNDHVDMFTVKPKIDMRFTEKPFLFGEVRGEKGTVVNSMRGKLMKHAQFGDKTLYDINMRMHQKVSGFNGKIRYDEEICGTIPANERDFRFCDKLMCSDYDYMVCGTFPLDYIFGKADGDMVKYIVGMSVAPVMMAQIATRIWEHWLSKIK
jgi:DNA (cytosine-5)-methyltransferase 1